MKIMRQHRWLKFWLVLGAAAILASRLMAQDASTNNAPVPADDFRITKAVFGAGGSWRDVTDVLQKHVSGGTLILDIRQPFGELGGDPAFGFVKSLIVEYRADGESHRVAMKESSPVAFALRLPSPDASAAGRGPGISQIIAAAQAAAPARNGPPGNGSVISLIALFISLVALGCSVAALVKGKRV